MKIVIIGGVAGGASAAARARRLSETAEIIVLERGQYVSFANCGLPYHIGGVIKRREALILKTPDNFKQTFNIEVRTQHEVISIDPDIQTVMIKKIVSGEIYTETWDRLLISTGAAPIVPPLSGLTYPGIFTLRNLLDMDHIQSWIQDHSVTHATVVGGGFIGLEVMEALVHRGISVTLLEMGAQVMAPVDPEMAVLLHQEIRQNGVDLRLKTALNAIHQHENGLCAVLSDGDTVNTGMVILAIGVKPESSLAKVAGLTLSERGGIVVNEYMQTSMPKIYAVGDVVESFDFVTQGSMMLPLAGPANRQGRIAADNMLGRSSRYQGHQGTSICQIFSINIGGTGLNEKQLNAQQKAYEKIYVHAANHAGYYPNATIMSLKLLFDPKQGTLLGMQVFGQQGVDKRIDVFAVAQRAGLKVTDLEHLELSYAPPFNSARDILNQAGMVASNVLSGDTIIAHAEDLIELNRAHQCLLDIRSHEELSTLGHYPDAIHIPLTELRQQLDQLPKDKEILIGCQTGLRGHVALRLLTAHGFNARNLTGGYKTWQMMMAVRSH